MNIILSLILLLAGGAELPWPTQLVSDRLREMQKFAKAIHGPGEGCSAESFWSRMCTQKPGEVSMTCTEYGGTTWYSCGEFNPAHLVCCDRDGDNDVDLRDWADYQNEWRHE